MGLCKCVKKKVTNQFCFEHRINVCENCMVEDHPQCVVQSYLQWLNDCDYNPVCQLCQEKLVTAECVRLVCYDVFHRSCLDEWASKLPSNTAPAGYRCPVCSSVIFPAPNLVSPVADVLRSILASCEWARTGLGMPLVKGDISTSNENIFRQDSSFTKLIETHQSNLNVDRGIPDGHDPTVNVNIPPEQFHILGTSQHRSASTVVAEVSRKQISDTSTIYMNNPEEDIGDNKYKRRPALEWLNRWIRTFQRPSSRHHQSIFGGKRRMGLILGLLTICSVIAILSYIGRNNSNNDPMLDPFNNPNIHVQEE